MMLSEKKIITGITVAKRPFAGRTDERQHLIIRVHPSRPHKVRLIPPYYYLLEKFLLKNREKQLGWTKGSH